MGADTGFCEVPVSFVHVDGGISNFQTANGEIGEEFGENLVCIGCAYR